MEYMNAWSRDELSLIQSPDQVQVQRTGQNWDWYEAYFLATSAECGLLTVKQWQIPASIVNLDYNLKRIFWCLNLID